MSEQTKISVIVPVYNVEDYLCDCVGSIIGQTYGNLEIILVDDGSTDASGAICDEYAKADPRIRTIHKENGGLSDARNVGFAASTGEYVAFVDSDDYVSPVFLECLYDAIRQTGCDVSGFPIGRIFKDGESCELAQGMGELPAPRQVPVERAQEMMLYQRLDNGAPWRLYKRGLLEGTPFPVGIYYEDLATMYKVLAKAPSIAIVDTDALYAYRTRGSSIINQDFSPIKLESAIDVSRQLYEDISRMYPDLANAAASRCFSVLRMVYAQAPQNDLESRNALWDELAKYKGRVSRDPNARKRERLAASIASAGRPPFDAFCAACRRLGLMR